MNKALVIRAIKFSLIFMTAFLILNLLTMKEASISSIIVRTVIAAIVFFCHLYHCIYNFKFVRT